MKKSPGIAVILNLFVYAGAGSMYAGRVGKGILYAVSITLVWVVGAVALSRDMGLRPDWGTALVCIIFALILGISSTVSAYNDANKYNDANVEKPAVESPKVVSHEYQPLTGIKRLV